MTSVPAPTSHSTSGTPDPGTAAAATAGDHGVTTTAPRIVRLPRWAAVSVAAAGLGLLVLATTPDRVPLLQLPSDSAPLGLPPAPLATANCRLTSGQGS